MQEISGLLGLIGQEGVLRLFLQSGCKEPKKLKIKSSGWTTIRCSEHEDREDHAKGKKASLHVNLATGAFRCMSCGYHGNMIAIASKITGGGFKEALSLLAEEAGVVMTGTQPVKRLYAKKIEPKQMVEYMRLDLEREFVAIDIEKWLKKIDRMTDKQKYKLLLTAIYRASLQTDQSKKVAYYEGRGIKNGKVGLIGFIHKGDLSFWQKIEKMFGIELLVHFGLYNAADAKYRPLAWKYNEDVNFIPSFDLYTDTLTGAMLRPIERPKNGAKEWSLNKPSLVTPIPFALTREGLASDAPIWFTEGSIDGLSLIQNPGKNFASIPGVNALDDSILGLFMGKNIVIAFDQDRAGQEGAASLQMRLLHAGALSVRIAQWDQSLGKDLNELLLNGNLSQIIA